MLNKIKDFFEEKLKAFADHRDSTLYLNDVLNGGIDTDEELKQLPKKEIPLADWDDPRVQAAYDILTEDDEPPEGEHWEGFVARRIVAKLQSMQSENKV